MKWLIIICALVLATQYPPVKSYIDNQIRRVNQQLDSKKEETQQREESIKEDYMQQSK